MRKGYLLAEAMIAIVIVGIIAAVFTSMNYYAYLQSNVLKQQNTKIILEVVRSRLINLAANPDTDAYFELLKEVNSTLPIDAGIGTDAWGKRIFYSTIDLGTVDVLNDPYANTNTSISPTANIAGRLVSFGENGVLDTNASDSIAQSDDLMLEIGVGELNHYKLYGSSEITTETRGYNSAVISDTAPASPINGSLWYDTTDGNLTIYDSNSSSWIKL